MFVERQKGPDADSAGLGPHPSPLSHTGLRLRNLIYMLLPVLNQYEMCSAASPAPKVCALQKAPSQEQARHGAFCFHELNGDCGSRGGNAVSSGGRFLVPGVTFPAEEKRLYSHTDRLGDP